MAYKITSEFRLKDLTERSKQSVIVFKYKGLYYLHGSRLLAIFNETKNMKGISM